MSWQRRFSSRRPGPTRVGRATSATCRIRRAADVFARYHRLKGNDVLMVSGTDEHGTPVMVSADKTGVSPRELADRNNELIRIDLRNLGISYDCFTRTTTRNHTWVTQDIFRTLYDKGYLVEQTTLGAFSPDGRTLSGPLHRGHVPDLRLPGSARRPVRQLRQPARPRRSDQSAFDHRRLDARVPRDAAPVPDLPAFAERLEEWLSAQEAGAPTSRILPRARARAEAACDDARLDWACPCRSTAIRKTRSGSTSGSTQ